MQHCSLQQPSRLTYASSPTPCIRATNRGKYDRQRNLLRALCPVGGLCAPALSHQTLVAQGESITEGTPNPHRRTLNFDVDADARHRCKLPRPTGLPLTAAEQTTTVWRGPVHSKQSMAAMFRGFVSNKLCVTVCGLLSLPQACPRLPCAGDTKRGISAGTIFGAPTARSTVAACCCIHSLIERKACVPSERRRTTSPLLQRLEAPDCSTPTAYCTSKRFRTCAMC